MVEKISKILLLFLLFSNFTKAQTVDSNYVDGQLYVKVKQSSSVNLLPDSNSLNVLDNILNNVLYGVDSIIRPFYGLNDTLDRVYKIYFSNLNTVAQLITQLETLTFIQYAESVPLYYAHHVPNDIHQDQYHLDIIDAKLAWDVSLGSENVVVAIIDNGVLLSHEDLSANIWNNPNETNNGLDDDLNGYVDDINGWDVADNDNDPSPPSNISSNSAFSHGTACAGIASATTNNGKGIASIGYKVKIMPVKCTKDDSDGNTLANADDGVFYAIKNNADVISMSYGSSSDAVTSRSIIQSASDNNIVLVSSAGNDSANKANYPASYDAVIAVGATNQNDEKAYYSNYGPNVDLMAPGSFMYTTIASSNSAYGLYSGTSMACPLVAGLVALYKSQFPSASMAAIKAALIEGCENIDAENPNLNGQLGAGRINAYATLGGDPPVFTKNIANHLQWTLSPNPANDRLLFEIKNAPHAKLQLNIYSLSGKEVFTQTFNPSKSATTEISTGQWVEGIYLFVLKNDSFFISKKVFVEHQ